LRAEPPAPAQNCSPLVETAERFGAKRQKC
jgi:hypothetical protein